jgi:Tfp pilus assembly protein PilP
VKCLRFIVAVTLIALAGCGGDSLDDFIYDLVTYCADVNKNVSKGLNNEEIAAEVNGFVDKAEARRKNKLLPLHEAQQYDKFIAKMKAAAGEFQRAHDAQTAGKKKEADAAVARAMQRTGEADRLARELGMPHLKDCEAWLRNSASPNR